MWQLPKNKPSHQYKIIYNNTERCVRHSRSMKKHSKFSNTLVLCNCGIIRTLNILRQTRECQTRNAGLLERREQVLKAKKSGGIIIEAVLLEKAALSERIQYIYFKKSARALPWNTFLGFSVENIMRFRILYIFW